MLSNLRKSDITFAAAGAVLVGTLATAGLVMAHDHEKNERYSYEEETEIEIRMVPSGGFSQAQGTIEWSEDSDDGYTEFEVDIEYLPEGDYTLFVGGEQRGVIQARADGDNDGAEGELEFYSDGRDSAPVLDFDPFGQLIEVRSGDEVVFSVTMPEKQDLLVHGTSATKEGENNRYRGDKERDQGKGGRYEEYASYETERWVLYLENTGSYPAAKAMVELVIDEDGRELDVEVDDLPIGSYIFRVGGQDRGNLVVSAYTSRDGDADANETEGELGFSEELDDEDDQPLDFELKGADIEILDGDRVVFRGTLK